MRIPASAALAAILLVAAQQGFAQPADTILTGGKVLAADAKFQVHEALAVRDGRIVAAGKAADVARLRGPGELPTREEALRLYTSGSAWFDHSERKRGTLEPGRLADLAVLSKDYLAVPVGEIGGIESLLTMLGGRIVYATGPYGKLEDR